MISVLTTHQLNGIPELVRSGITQTCNDVEQNMQCNVSYRVTFDFLFQLEATVDLILLDGIVDVIRPQHLSPVGQVLL